LYCISAPELNPVSSYFSRMVYLRTPFPVFPVLKLILLHQTVAKKQWKIPVIVTFVRPVQFFAVGFKAHASIQGNPYRRSDRCAIFLYILYILSISTAFGICKLLFFSASRMPLTSCLPKLFPYRCMCYFTRDCLL
jgi:hypothetical protein